MPTTTPIAPPEAIAHQLIYVAKMLAFSPNGLTLEAIALHWKGNPGCTAILNRLNWLINLGFVTAEVRVNAPKLYRWNPPKCSG